MRAEIESAATALAHGVRIPDFQEGHEFPSIRAAVDSREAHVEMHDLIRSIREHSHAPSTFDGEAPAFAFQSAQHRLIVGERLSAPDGNGGSCEGVLEQGLVMPQSNEAHCVIRLDDGRRVICRVPLTDQEMQAWRQHPRTFFGVIDLNVREPAKSAVDWFDFFFASYRNTPRERLLDFMKDSPDIEQLSKLDQVELARTYCERLAMHVMHDQERLRPGAGPEPPASP